MVLITRGRNIFWSYCKRHLTQETRISGQHVGRRSACSRQFKCKWSARVAHDVNKAHIYQCFNFFPVPRRTASHHKSWNFIIFFAALRRIAPRMMWTSPTYITSVSHRAAHSENETLCIKWANMRPSVCSSALNTAQFKKKHWSLQKM